MAGQKRYEFSFLNHGMWNVRLISWRFFGEFINKHYLDFRSSVWRGQCAAKWELESSLDRLLREKNGVNSSELLGEQHLSRFQHAVRGRRGANPPLIQSENEWWALGQHHGLATPLLDWTRSPYVALFFAFSQGDVADDYRAVYALHQNMVNGTSDAISSTHSGQGRAPIVEFVSPLSDENARLVNQGGLFTRAPSGYTIEAWAREFIQHSDTRILFTKFIIPNKGREDCLRALNLMNINHLSLFPDLYGASKFANYQLRIDKY